MNAQVVKMMRQGLVTADEIDKQVVDLRMNLEQWTLPSSPSFSCANGELVTGIRNQRFLPRNEAANDAHRKATLKRPEGSSQTGKHMYSVTGRLAICAGAYCPAVL
jgi:hypothetical protein